MLNKTETVLPPTPELIMIGLMGSYELILNGLEGTNSMGNAVYPETASCFVSIGVYSLRATLKIADKCNVAIDESERKKAEETILKFTGYKPNSSRR